MAALACTFHRWMGAALAMVMWNLATSHSNEGNLVFNLATHAEENCLPRTFDFPFRYPS